MQNLIATLVFILPGFMAYYWIQSFGKNPVVKHSAAEFAVISALLWVPVTGLSLCIYNVATLLVRGTVTWSLGGLLSASTCMGFIFGFTLLNALTSFLFSWAWVQWVQKWLDSIVNDVRTKRKLAPFSEMSSVWDEFFHRIDHDTEEKEQVLMVHKIDNPKEYVVGSMTRVSRTFEPDRQLVLEDVDGWTRSYNEDYHFAIKRVFIDTKSGILIKELDHKNPTPRNKNANFAADDTNLSSEAEAGELS